MKDEARNVSSGRIEVKNLNSLKNIRLCVAAEVKNFMNVLAFPESVQVCLDYCGFKLQLRYSSSNGIVGCRGHQNVG
jgi:hypothetical protein